jgi:tRNA pseudouridine38-40 synthase
MHLDMEADGFLYNMVRIIAGTLVEVGRGKMLAGEVKGILSARDRRQAGPTLPARGLCLVKVKYR